jgi:hypothetical protein
MVKIEEPDANNSHESVRGLDLGVKFCSRVRNRPKESVMRRIVKLLFEKQAAIKRFGGWLATMSASPRDVEDAKMRRQSDPELEAQGVRPGFPTPPPCQVRPPACIHSTVPSSRTPLAPLVSSRPTLPGAPNPRPRFGIWARASRQRSNPRHPGLSAWRASRPQGTRGTANRRGAPDASCPELVGRQLISGAQNKMFAVRSS